MEKTKKREEGLQQNHSFVAKSLPKTSESLSNGQGAVKKSVSKKEVGKHTLQQINSNTDYLKAKFYKVSKGEKLKSPNESVNNVKETAKPHHLMHQGDDKVTEHQKPA
jgi:hypothetical protein